MQTSDHSPPQPVTWRALELLIAMSSVCVALWYCLSILAQPAQRGMAVDEMTRAVNKYITAPDTTPRGIRYRWVPAAVPVTLPLPFAQHIVRFDSWVWPGATRFRLDIGARSYEIPVTVAEQPRRYQVYLPPTADQSAVTISMQVDGAKPFWAFSGMDVIPLTRLPHPQILALYLFLTALVSVLARRWRIPWGGAVLVSQVCIVVWALQTTPIAIYLPQTLARSDRAALVTGLVLTVGVIAAAPAARPWFARATRPQRITLLSTALICVAPLIATLYGPEPLSERVTENRRLTAFPSTIPTDMAAVSAAAIQTEQWLSDHYGWRSLFIRAKNELDYRVFGTSSRVYYGSNDFIYMRRWTDERFPALDSALRDPARRARLTARIRERVALYRDLGIRPIMVIAPSKEIIYPEHLPWYVPRYDTTLLREYIAELNAAGIEVIDGEQLLLAEKAHQPLLFHKQDFHWNRVAAHLVADEVQRRVSQTFPPVRAFAREVQIVTAPSPFADRDFAARWFDRYAVPPGVDIALPLPVGGEWRNTTDLGVAMDVWEGPTDQTAFPGQNLHIVGDSFSVRFIGAGFEYGFPRIYRSFFPTDAAAYPQWLRDHSISVVLWQLRDGGLTYFLDGLAEQ